MAHKPDRRRPGFFTAYSFGIITAGLFLVSWAAQFTFQLIEVRNDAAEHGQAFQWDQFWPQFLSSTFENWQSEFLQLLWQAAGLALFFFWGSSQSKESDDRLEAKLDRILELQGVDVDEFEWRENDQAEEQLHQRHDGPERS
ncbi:DUF6766 family protein [Occultella gossypii]|uniref:Uncharacterized protein n=1 Tax=Occultella gossypii TaxID=2800820 RepID=A0ABS7SFR6_9MICO|nr:DUF6766 family protein [Occultella gossypii]MBZ2199072.1 hypothetical protein [Occultella gossypii]